MTLYQEIALKTPEAAYPIPLSAKLGEVAKLNLPVLQKIDGAGAPAQRDRVLGWMQEVSADFGPQYPAVVRAVQTDLVIWRCAQMGFEFRKVGDAEALPIPVFDMGGAAEISEVIVQFGDSFVEHLGDGAQEMLRHALNIHRRVLLSMMKRHSSI